MRIAGIHARTLFVLLCLLPPFFVGLEAANSLVGDNLNYFNAYDLIEPTPLGISYSYGSYLLHTGSSVFEIGLFAYFFLAKLISLDYQSAVALLNTWLALVLALSLAKHCRSLPSCVLIGSLLATSYYSIIIFSELHKLALSICLLISLWLFQLPARISISLSPFFHAQALLFWPLSVRRNLTNRHLAFATLLILILSPVVMPLISQKLAFYDVSSAGSQVIMFIIFSALLCQVFITMRTRLKWFLVACAPLLAVGSVVGSGRINFMLFVFYFALFISKANQSGLSALASLIFSLTAILFVAEGIEKTSFYLATTSLSYPLI